MAQNKSTGLVQQLHHFWPDFPCTKEDILNPNQEFMVRFFQSFLNEVTEKLHYLCNSEPNKELEEIINSERCSDIDSIINLCTKVQQILKDIDHNNSNAFTISLKDFIMPTQKRTFILIKLSLHFMIFINNALDETAEVVNVALDKATKIQNLSVLKEQLLCDTAENSINIAKAEDTYESLITHLEESKKCHAQMLRDKINHEKIYKENLKQLEHHDRGCESLTRTLKTQEVKEQQLREQVVTEEELQRLKTIEAMIKDEQEQLFREDLDYDANVDLEIESCKDLANIANDLKAASYATLLRQSSQMQALKIEVKEKQGVFSGLKENEKALYQSKAEVKNRLEAELEEEEETQKMALQAKAEMKRKIAKASQRLQENGQDLVDMDFRCGALRREIGELEQEDEEIGGEDEALKRVAITHYKKILDASTNGTNRFHASLMNLKKI